MMPDALLTFLARGGPVLWLIAALSVLTLALILWKIWRLSLMGAWSGSATRAAIALWSDGQTEAALATVAGRRSLRARLAHAAMTARLDDSLTEAAGARGNRPPRPRRSGHGADRAAGAGTDRHHRAAARPARHGPGHDRGLPDAAGRPAPAPIRRRWPAASGRRC